MVKGVVRFRLEPAVDAVFLSKIFEHGKIDIRIARTAQAIARYVAKSSNGRRNEGRSIEIFLDLAYAGRAGWITHLIRIVVANPG